MRQPASTMYLPLHNHPLHHHGIWIWHIYILHFTLVCPPCHSAACTRTIFFRNNWCKCWSGDMHFAHQDCRRNNLFLSLASFSLLTKVTVIVCSLQIVFWIVWHCIPSKGLHELVGVLAPPPPPHTHVLLTHCRNHSVEEVTNFTSTGSDCCGDDYIGWCPFHEVVEGEEYITIEISRFCS